jgi:hypothetical protein
VIARSVVVVLLGLPPHRFVINQSGTEIIFRLTGKATDTATPS